MECNQVLMLVFWGEEKMGVPGREVWKPLKEEYMQNQETHCIMHNYQFGKWTCHNDNCYYHWANPASLITTITVWLIFVLVTLLSLTVIVLWNVH